jgi:hypothetical protein
MNRKQFVKSFGKKNLSFSYVILQCMSYSGGSLGFPIDTNMTFYTGLSKEHSSQTLYKIVEWC